MSRRQFVGGLTKAGLTATAAQSVLASVSIVSLAEGTAPPPPAGRSCGSCRNSAGRAAASGAVAGVKAVPGPRRRGLRRAAHRLGREIRVRQFGQRGCAVLRGAGRPAAAQIHPDAARGPRRRDGVGLHQGLGRARDRDAGRRWSVWPTPSARCSTPSRSRRRSSSTPIAPTSRVAPAATASRRFPTRSRWSSRSPSTPGWRAVPT